MSELVELSKLIIENKSSSLIGLIIVVFIILKAQPILDTIITIRDLNKKRLIQRFEEAYRLHDKKMLEGDLKESYQRLCYETQMRAIIGCSHCSKELANYIFTREDISKAIFVYHRVKDYIKVENGEVLPKKQMSKFRIKLNDYAGTVFYFLIASFGLLPIFLYMVLKLFGIKIDVGSDFFISAFFSASVAFFIGFHILNLSFKPFLTDVFCNYKKHESVCESNSEQTDDSKAA